MRGTFIASPGEHADRLGLGRDREEPAGLLVFDLSLDGLHAGLGRADEENPREEPESLLLAARAPVATVGGKLSSDRGKRLGSTIDLEEVGMLVAPDPEPAEGVGAKRLGSAAGAREAPPRERLGPELEQLDLPFTLRLDEADVGFGYLKAVGEEGEARGPGLSQPPAPGRPAGCGESLTGGVERVDVGGRAGAGTADRALKS